GLAKHGRFLLFCWMRSHILDHQSDERSVRFTTVVAKSCAKIGRGHLRMLQKNAPGRFPHPGHSSPAARLTWGVSRLRPGAGRKRGQTLFLSPDARLEL